MMEKKEIYSRLYRDYSKKYLKKHYTENTNLLLMSSGNFNKLNYNEI